MTFQPHHEQLLPSVQTKATLLTFEVVAPFPVIISLGKKDLILLSSL